MLTIFTMSNIAVLLQFTNSGSIGLAERIVLKVLKSYFKSKFLIIDFYLMLKEHESLCIS